MNFRDSNDQDSSLQDLNVDNVQNGPGDTVSCISWAPNVQYRLFGAGAWDSKLRLYEVVAQMQKYLALKTTINLDDTPLSLSWTNDCTKIFAGLANNYVSLIDIQAGKSTKCWSPRSWSEGRVLAGTRQPRCLAFFR